MNRPPKIGPAPLTPAVGFVLVVPEVSLRAGQR
jgi:hypothetical protein